MAIFYISGPITGVEDYMDAFYEEEVRLAEDGHTVINPCHAFGGREGLPYSVYMRFHIHSILNADALLMLPGWQNSRGAMFENRMAHMLSLPAYVRDEDGNLNILHLTGD